MLLQRLRCVGEEQQFEALALVETLASNGPDHHERRLGEKLRLITSDQDAQVTEVSKKIHTLLGVKKRKRHVDRLEENNLL